MPPLPFPTNQEEISKLLAPVDERLLNCHERFIRLQVKKPVEDLFTGKVDNFTSDTAQYDWFNVYSIYSANQQVNEACNKLWATVELANVTSRRIWKKSYNPIGEDFAGTFLLGTLIPTLHYSELSSMISIMSSFGCVPTIVRKKPCYLVRTVSGWRLFGRGEYLNQTLGASPHGWHDQIIRTYEKLSEKGIRLPNLDINKVCKLKELRNSMHYEVLGDLKMWRMIKSKKAYSSHLDLVVETTNIALDNLHKLKKVTGGSDVRFTSLKRNLEKLRLD